MGMFSGIKDAEILERGVYIKPGFIGELLVKRTIAKETLKSGVGFIVEFEVVASNLDDHPVGSKVTWFQKMTDKTVAFPAIKAFVAALSGLESWQKDDIDEQVSPVLEELLSKAVASPSKNDLVGIKVHVTTEQTKTQKGLDFTRHNWSPSQAA